MYIYNRSGKSFISTFSIDDAFWQGLNYDYELGYITLSDQKTEYADFIQDYIHVEKVIHHNECNSTDIIQPAENPVSTAVTNSNTLKLSIQFYWHPDATHTLPLKNAKIVIFEMLGTTYRHLNFGHTDENGFYYVEIPYGQLDYYLDGGKILMDIEPASRRVSMSATSASYYEYDLTDDITLGEVTALNFHLNFNSQLTAYRCMYIIQCMLIGERFATEMGADLYGEHFTIHYPDSLTFCWDSNAYIEEDYYYDVDTLIHEFGHFVQQTQGFGLELTDIPRPPVHTLLEDKMESYLSKNFAAKLTWTESWATVFSVIAQYEYQEDYIGIPNFGNISYMGHPLESPDLNENSGEFQELSIIGMLWDMYDNASESHDSLSLGAQKWWNYTTHEGTIKLTHFIEDVQAYYPHSMQKIGAIMSAHRISPVLTVQNSTSVSTTVAPQLSWRVNGSQNNPNDRFDVVIYDQYGEELYSVTGLDGSGYAYDDQYSYSVPSSVWSSIMEAYAGTFTINFTVYSYRSAETPITGPYPSNQVSLNFNYTQQSFNFNGHDRYIEKPIVMNKDQNCRFTVTFQTAGPKLIQTFGATDTILKLYNGNGTLLASNDDGGYSLNGLLSYNADAGESCIIEVSFYIDDEETDYGFCCTKLAVTPASTVRTSGTVITSYENISNITNKTAYQTTIIMDKNCTTVLRFTPPSAGTYTVQTSGDHDTYLYIVDPHSHEKLSNSYYNDDSGNGTNASITIHLDANMSYLIISPYNPGNLSDFIGCSLQINIS